MALEIKPFNVYLETGHNKTFAVTLDWPGWCRAGRDEASALQALVDYGPRYSRILEGTLLDFRPPSSAANFQVVQRLPGNATTDFGAPNIHLAAEPNPISPNDLKRWQVIYDAGWRAFNQVVQAAQGKSLRKGPRGGGRDLEEITAHVRKSQTTSLSALGGRITPGLENDPERLQMMTREAILTTLASAARGEITQVRPRGGKLWSPRYFIRRFMWHLLDHVWEIEDRVE